MIGILMAVYNGEKYLSQQLDSLFAQTYQDFFLIIRDDGSADQSVSVIEKYIRLYPGRIYFYQNRDQTHGACQNFFALSRIGLKYSADYYMFCDQDDIWKPDKILVSLQEIRKLEGQNPASPLLIHTDLMTIDTAGKCIDRSFMARERINPQPGWNHLLLQNNATGCTFLFNRKLLEKAVQPLEPSAVSQIYMHDWWFILCAVTFGKASYLPSALIEYRQHGENNIGAFSQLNFNGYKQKWKKNQIPLSERLPYKTIKTFFTTYQQDLSEPVFKLLKEYLALPDQSKVRRILFLKRNHIQAQNAIATIFKYLTI